MNDTGVILLIGVQGIIVLFIRRDMDAWLMMVVGVTVAVMYVCAFVGNFIH